MKRFARYKCLVKFRSEFNGNKLKDRVKKLNGHTFTLVCGWQNEPNEKYPGEYAMIPITIKDNNIFVESGIYWIASGDLEIDNV